MKIDAQITMLFNEDGLRIEVHDADASITFLEIHLDATQTCQAFSRLSHTKVSACEVRGIEKVGKKMEWDTLEFPFNDHTVSYNERDELAYQEALKACPEGWTPSGHFGSQGSFFDKDGVRHARTTIRRWVEKPTP